MSYCSSYQSPCRNQVKILSYTNHDELLQLLSIPLPYPSHNIIIQKSLWVTAVPVNRPAVTKSQYYNIKSTMNYCSCCQSPYRTKITIFSYTKLYEQLQVLSIPFRTQFTIFSYSNHYEFLQLLSINMSYKIHKIIIHKYYELVQVPSIRLSYRKSQHYHTQSDTNYCSSCQSPCRIQFTKLSYKMHYKLLQLLLIQLPYRNSQNYYTKLLHFTASTFNQPAVHKSQHYHTQSANNFCTSCQNTCRTQGTISHTKTLIITAVSDKPTSVPMSKYYHTLSTKNYCSSFKHPAVTQVKILSYTIN